MPVRALVFDLWGTLIEDSAVRMEPRAAVRWRAMLAALEAAGAGTGQRFPEETVRSAFKTFLDDCDGIQKQGRDLAMPEKVELFFERIEAGLARRLGAEAMDAMEAALANAVRAHPPVPAAGAHDVLEEARRRGLALGLVSNTGITPGYALRELLSGYGLLEWLEVLTFSDEACLAKPAGAIFRCTLEALGVAPEEAVFIGDTPELDVVGPRAVGMWTVQIGEKQLDGVEPHARIGALPELFDALGRLGLLA